MAKKILYIEDNLDNMLLIQRLCSAWGYKFVWSIDGLSGLERARLDHPDLILVDINLPDIDGYEVMRRLRSDNYRCTVPILALTANAYPGDLERARQAGCNGYFTKPVRINDLRCQIETLLTDLQGAGVAHTPGLWCRP